MTRASVTVLGMVAMAGSASAQEAKTGYEVGEAAKWIYELRKGEDFNDLKDTKIADACDADIAAARKQGLKILLGSFEKWGGKQHETGWTSITLDAGVKICEETRLWTHAMLAYADLGWTAQMVSYLDDESMPRHIADDAIAYADKCDKHVADFEAKKIPSTWPYPISHGGQEITKTIADIKPKLCEPARKVATKFAKEADERQAAYDAQMKKAGIVGEKREWYDHYRGNVFLAGGKNPDDLKKYGAASVWFAYTYSSEPDSRGNHTFEVRRYQWKGSKLAKSSSKTYQKPLSFKNAIGSVMK